MKFTLKKLCSAVHLTADYLVDDIPLTGQQSELLEYMQKELSHEIAMQAMFGESKHKRRFRKAGARLIREIEEIRF